jgi:hypothetical protein
MDDLPEKSPALDLETSNLQQQYDSLRQLVISLLILLLVVSGTFNIYLLRQLRSTSKDLTSYQPFAANVITSYQKGDGPAVEAFVRNVAEFSRTHPDFAPILAKYGIKATSFTPPVVPPANTSPAASPVKRPGGK